MATKKAKSRPKKPKKAAKARVQKKTPRKAKVSHAPPKTAEPKPLPAVKPKAPRAKTSHKPFSFDEVMKTKVAAPPKVEPKTDKKPAAFQISRKMKASPAISAPETEEIKPEEKKPQIIQLSGPIMIKDLAAKLSVNPSQLITQLIGKGIFANINQSLTLETVEGCAEELGFVIEKPDADVEEPKTAKSVKADQTGWVSRPPIVTLMGHVDHGKTSLLDAIRKTDKVSGETGGITQHIGAYEVFLENGAVTFLDTPGHEAFTAMRARGAQATDIVVIVVAADDGIMPQTEEAIDHARAADAPIVVAINKIDLPGANVDRVKKALMERDLNPEDWGGKTSTVCVSAKNATGIKELLETLLLEAELLELKANPNIPAQGVVVEAALSKKSGPVATLLVQHGTLRVGDIVVCGHHYGKARAMINDRGERVSQAGPAAPVEILGLSGVPRAGDTFKVVPHETKAREACEKLIREEKEKSRGSHVKLEELYQDFKAGKVNTLKLVLKADVQGSVEALKQTLSAIISKEVKLKIIHTGTGVVTESDVMLAAASNAIVMGFHVDVSPSAQELAKKEEVDVRLYDIIYEAKSSIEKALEGLLVPDVKEVFIGRAEVRQAFKLSKSGAIAGCMVLDGKIIRSAKCRIVRDGKVVHKGKVVGLKRFKDDAKDVSKGFECGISVSDYKNITQGDKIEVFEVQSTARTLKR